MRPCLLLCSQTQLRSTNYIAIDTMVCHVPNARNSAGDLRPLDGSPGKKERMLAKKQHEARATSEASVEDCCWVYWTIP